VTGPLPVISPENEFFWRAGADGELRILRCQSCAHFIHPPKPTCPVCFSREVGPQPVSGHAVLASYTVNEQAWVPGLAVPFSIGLVELEEQAGLRLTTNIVNVAIEDLRIGMKLRVVFVQREDVWLPLFEPDVAA
jgi:uncharacterized OB-fold protein